MVNKNIVIWNPTICQSITGKNIEVELVFIISIAYKGTLINEILCMQPKSAISLSHAISLISQKQIECLKSPSFSYKEYSWYIDNFIKYISSIGYHIELNGDEFVSHHQSDFQH